MTRVILIAIVFTGSSVSAQPVRPSIALKAPGGLGGGSSPDQLSQSQIVLAANQLQAELNNLRTETAKLRLGLAERIELSRLADRAVQEATELRKLAYATSDRRRLLAADRAVDAAAEALITRAQQLAAGSPTLAGAIARAQYADQQLHVLLGIDAAGGSTSRIIRTAATLIDQVGNLRELARNEFPPNHYPPQLDRQVRTYGFRIGTLQRNLEAGGSLAQAATDYAAAVQQWRAIAPGLLALQSNAEVRIQIARVDGLSRQLGRLLGVNAGPGIPDIGFLAKGMFACGAGETGGPRVTVFAQVGGPPLFDFFAYDPQFRGGVRVAVADLNGDGIPELVTAPGGPLPGQVGLPPLVRIFDGRTMSLVTEFLAYERTWTGGVQIAAANLTRQGRAIIATGADVGAGPHVRAFDLANGREAASFYAYDQNFRGGVRVALGDVDGDGLPDIVTAPGPQHPPQIKIFAGTNGRLMTQWLAYDPNHTVGAYVATADITRNGQADVIVGPDVAGSGVVRVFNAQRANLLGEVSPYPAKFRGGIRVAALDVNGDGIPDVICAPGPDVPAPVRVFDGRNTKPIVEFFPFERNFAGGVFIGAR